MRRVTEINMERAGNGWELKWGELNEATYTPYDRKGNKLEPKTHDVATYHTEVYEDLDGLMNRLETLLDLQVPR